MLGLKVKTPNRTLSLSVPASTKVAKLKEMVSEKEGVQTGMMKVSQAPFSGFSALFVQWSLMHGCPCQVIFGGKELDDTKTLEASQVMDGAALFSVLRQKVKQLQIKTLKDRYVLPPPPAPLLS
jgi:hypothetical protein